MLGLILFSYFINIARKVFIIFLFIIFLAISRTEFINEEIAIIFSKKLFL